MRTVHKYPFILTDDVSIHLPRGARILHVAPGDMDHVAFLWAEVDTEAPMEPAGLHVHGTGHKIPDGRRHVATWLAGPFVWHLYQEEA